MEGVGARLGRSSTRYGGPTTVFSGSVRKWKKRWVPLSNPNSNNNHSNSSSSSNNHRSNNNGNNINNPSHLLIYKWTPISKDSSAALAEEPPRKKFRYVPVAVIEEQKQEEAAAAAVKSDDEAQPAEDEAAAAEPMETDGFDAKPEVNEVKEEETEAVNKDGASGEEINETNLDLNLGLKTRDGDNGSDPKTGEGEGSDQLER